MSNGQPPNILILYTGGTIGMIRSPKGANFQVAGLDELLKYCPSMEEFPAQTSFLALDKIKDSSNISAEDWMNLSKLITENTQYDGYVVLHGTDTMCYAATAQSYLLTALNKPVIFTGAQIPLSEPNSDGEDNLRGALGFALELCQQELTQAVVGIYFDGRLFQANRTVKYSSADLAAFQSPNFEELGIQSGRYLLFDNHSYQSTATDFSAGFSDEVLLIKMHPNLSESGLIKYIQTVQPKGILLESFGTGNIPESAAFISCLEEQISNSCLILNCTQCLNGSVACPSTKWENNCLK